MVQKTAFSLRVLANSLVAGLEPTTSSFCIGSDADGDVARNKDSTNLSKNRQNIGRAARLNQQQTAASQTLPLSLGSPGD